MPERLAGDIGWLGGGLLFAWLLGALAQLAMFAAPRGSRARCGRRPAAPQPRVAYSRAGCAVSLLLLVPSVLAAAGASQAAHAVAATGAGALGGVWLARRRGSTRDPRLVAIAGCVTGSVGLAGGFAFQLLFPQADVLDRGALYLAVSLGALVLAASASAWFVGAGRSGLDGSRRRTASAAFDDRVAYGLALTLSAALAYGFVTADASAQFRLAALVAASGLAAALGLRLMTGAHRLVAYRFPVAGFRTGMARVDAHPFVRPGLAGIPDELLVAACGGETFDAACLLPFAASAPERFDPHGAVAPALPRRRRGRYGGPRARCEPAGRGTRTTAPTAFRMGSALDSQ